MLWNRRCVTDRERQEQRRIGDAGNGQDAAILHAAAAGRDLAGRTWSFRGQAVPPAAQSKNPQSIFALGILLFGVADGARTHDNRNHNPGLYQLSYSHRRRTLFYSKKLLDF